MLCAVCGTQAEQDERFLQITQEEVDRPAGEQKEEHRLALEIGQAGERAGATVRGQLVVSIRAQALAYL